MKPMYGEEGASGYYIMLHRTIQGRPVFTRLSGPYRRHAEAWRLVPRAAEIVQAHDQKTRMDSFSVSCAEQGTLMEPGALQKILGYPLDLAPLP